MAFEKFTLRQRPDLEEQVHRLNGESWPTFLLHGDISHWESLFDEPADVLIAVGHTVPFVWDGTREVTLSPPRTLFPDVVCANPEAGN